MNATKIKLATVETRNFSFSAAYEASKTDNSIRKEFTKAAKKHIKQYGNIFYTEYWKTVLDDMQINTISLNTWYRDKEEI